MTPTNSPSKPGKLKRVLTLRPIEWVPILAGLLISVASVLWLVFSCSKFEDFGSSIPDQPMVFEAHLGPLPVLSVASYLSVSLGFFGFVCWLWRVTSIIRED